MRFFILKILFLFVLKIQAQDIHFSQFNVSNSLLDPSIIGTQSGDFRVSFQKRTQWKAVAYPFNTVAANFAVKNIIDNSSLELQFFNDVAGDSYITASQFNASINRNFAINVEQTFSLGLSLGISQRGADFSNLIFEENEDLKNISFRYFDLGIGANYSITKLDGINFIFGLSAFHINQPRQSLIKENDVNLEEKYNLYCKSFFSINNNISVNPALIYTRQGKSKELIFGSEIDLKTASSNIDIVSQIFYRLNDALIPAFGINYQNIKVIVSYDINISDLAIASYNKGGFEFSIIYNWNKKKNNKEQETIECCPIYL
tara:strand:- start:17793 stop:18743 length:951 start_codon:yes stop_codon:yes gene_type:complete